MTDTLDNSHFHHFHLRALNEVTPFCWQNYTSLNGCNTNYGRHSETAKTTMKTQLNAAHVSSSLNLPIARAAHSHERTLQWEPLLGFMLLLPLSTRTTSCSLLWVTRVLPHNCILWSLRILLRICITAIGRRPFSLKSTYVLPAK